VHRPTPLFRPDVFPRRWIQMCNAYARGEGWKVTGQQAPGKVKVEEIPLFAGASDTEPLGQ
jgi:hypothetical protein